MIEAISVMLLSIPAGFFVIAYAGWKTDKRLKALEEKVKNLESKQPLSENSENLS